jgi:hypothetical protein
MGLFRPRILSALLAFCFVVLTSAPAFAQSDDTYDPFADFSEFEDSAEEEADINFFLNGRFLTLGFLLGSRGFTQDLDTLYGKAPTFGLFLSYFFDLRFAIQISFLTGDHAFHMNAASPLNGNVSYTSLGIDLKYYLNTQNVTRGLAELNPYFIGGFSHVQRTVVLENEDKFDKQTPMALDLGLGIEIPMMRNKMYFGLQGMYQLVTFKDENRDIPDGAGNPSGQKGRGDSYTALGILGVNF